MAKRTSSIFEVVCFQVDDGVSERHSVVIVCLKCSVKSCVQEAASNSWRKALSPTFRPISTAEMGDFFARTQSYHKVRASEKRRRERETGKGREERDNKPDGRGNKYTVSYSQ